jgi:hypothetical protein
VLEKLDLLMEKKKSRKKGEDVETGKKRESEGRKERQKKLDLSFTHTQK